FGQYLAVSDIRGGLHIFDCQGRTVSQTQSPRPFHHLAFVPAAPCLIGSADFGLVACLDLNGNWTWRDGLVIHVGALAVPGGGERIALACFTEGLQRYSLKGGKLPPFTTVEPWQFVAMSFDGQKILVGGLSKRVHFLDGGGKTIRAFSLDAQPTALALDPL